MIDKILNTYSSYVMSDIRRKSSMDKLKHEVNSLSEPELEKLRAEAESRNLQKLLRYLPKKVSVVV